ncbi:glycerol dehydrogenase, partial [Cetobacterium somerae]|nr:glycerol dehydrogenase [Cetobacterium somerae]
RACEQSGALTMGGGLPTTAAMALAKLCFDPLIADGDQAMFSAQKCVFTKAV